MDSDKGRDFLKLYKSNKFKTSEEDIKSGIEDAMLDCLERYSDSE